ncbi:MAG: hypothetical protein KJO01_11675 [Gammaproteobacteria bacterium]|nr:hypothetical protein [Gammaproteobacteria bacterium]MBT8111381.1 hypothetical protein [Gammaproteobacteria bacterium]NND46044.1 hypothetical protein [Woeseiaceae bacterium]NNL46079.1 hypothetical protein [Woeseiaceae bacterium]
MAEKVKDAEDRLLESMFDSAPIADDGFSAKIVGRIRRRLWLRRLALPVAALIGGTIALKPLAGLVTAAVRLSSLLPQELLATTSALLPQAPLVVLGAMLLAAFLLGLRALDD